MGMTVDGSPTTGYCIDIGTEIQPGESGLDEVDWDTSGVQNLDTVAGILAAYAPNGTGPAGYEITGTDAQQAAATQAAIWHFTDGFNLTVGDNDPVIEANYAAILAAAAAGALPAAGEPDVSLTITPPAATEAEAGVLVGPFVRQHDGVRGDPDAVGRCHGDRRGRQPARVARHGRHRVLPDEPRRRRRLGHRHGHRHGAHGSCLREAGQPAADPRRPRRRRDRRPGAGLVDPASDDQHHGAARDDDDHGTARVHDDHGTAGRVDHDDRRDHARDQRRRPRAPRWRRPRRSSGRRAACPAPGRTWRGRSRLALGLLAVGLGLGVAARRRSS